MPVVTFVTSGGGTAEVPANTNLLVASLRHKGGIPFKCGGGKCGTCRCHIDQGLVHTDAVKPKERNHLSDDELRDGWRMACQTFVLGDVSVSWVPREPPAAPPPASGAT
jgi:ferredoxin